MSVEESTHLGISSGPKCSIAALILGTVYLLVTLAYTLTMRLYLLAYYTSAHVAGLGVMVALFVIAHHICRVRTSLGCCLKLFAGIQVFLNGVYLLCNVSMAAGYIITSVLSVHLNFDYIVAAALSCINIFFLVYLIVIVGAATRGDRYMDYEVDSQFVWHSDSLGGIGVVNDMELFGYPAYGDFGTGKTEKGSMGTNTSLMTKTSQQKKSINCGPCCRKFWNILFCFFYFWTQLILIIVFALSACHPAFIAADTFRYRESDDLYTVSLPGHRPLSLFLKCRGQGNETIVYDNDIGSTAYMAWNFVPRFLEDKYIVCVTDRRGYGWSETYEHDNISSLKDDNEQQLPYPNSEFFVKLIEAADIQTPFYFMGHGYGGHHIVQVALRHPDLIKGLFFLDSGNLSVIDSWDTVELVTNFNTMGIGYILTESNWYDIAKAAEEVLDIPALSDDITQKVFASIRSGYYMSSLLRETLLLDDGDTPVYKHIKEAISDSLINKTTYVIDAGSHHPGWFPSASFPFYNESLHYTFVPGAGHSLLTLSDMYGNITSAYIDTFIQYDLKQITETVLKTKLDAILCYAKQLEDKNYEC